MKEITSSYEGVEKRFGIALGLAALVFSSLACLVSGAGLESFLVRGLLALGLFSILGWWYGGFLRRLFEKGAGAEPAADPNVTVTSHDVQPIPDFQAPAEPPAAQAAGAGEAPRAVDFTLPEFSPAEGAETAPPA